MRTDPAAIEAAARALHAVVEPLRPGTPGPMPAGASAVAALRAFWAGLPPYRFFDFFLADRARWTERAPEQLARTVPGRYLVVGPPQLGPGPVAICDLDDEQLPIVTDGKRYPSLIQYLAHSAIHWMSWHMPHVEAELDPSQDGELAVPAVSDELRRVGDGMWLVPAQGELAAERRAWTVVGPTFDGVARWFANRTGWKIAGVYAPDLGRKHANLVADIDDPRFAALARVEYVYVSPYGGEPEPVIHRIGELGGVWTWITSVAGKLIVQTAVEAAPGFEAWRARVGL